MLAVDRLIVLHIGRKNYSDKPGDNFLWRRGLYYNYIFMLGISGGRSESTSYI